MKFWENLSKSYLPSWFPQSQSVPRKTLAPVNIPQASILTLFALFGIFTLKKKTKISKKQ